MWDKILPAIFGIVGTIVGASINGWITYHVATNRELVERERESRKQAAELQQAARLIEMDLSRVSGTVKQCIENRRWTYRDWPAFTQEGWQQYRAIIALELSHDDWFSVHLAVEAVDSLKTMRDIHVRGNDAAIAKDPDPDALQARIDAYRFNDEYIQSLNSSLKHITAGRLALAPYVSGQSKPRNAP